MTIAEDILAELREIKGVLLGFSQQGSNIEDLPDWFSLPTHLRKTIIVVFKLTEVTAYDVAKETRRARAVESGYLNQLVVLGYLKKERRGRVAWFMINVKGNVSK